MFLLNHRSRGTARRVDPLLAGCFSHRRQQGGWEAPLRPFPSFTPISTPVGWGTPLCTAISTLQDGETPPPSSFTSISTPGGGEPNSPPRSPPFRCQKVGNPLHHPVHLRFDARRWGTPPHLSFTHVSTPGGWGNHPPLSFTSISTVGPLRPRSPRFNERRWGNPSMPLVRPQEMGEPFPPPSFSPIHSHFDARDHLLDCLTTTNRSVTRNARREGVFGHGDHLHAPRLPSAVLHSKQAMGGFPFLSALCHDPSHCINY